MRPLASRTGGTISRRSGLATLGGLCLILAACAGPVGTTRAEPTVVLRDLARSATTSGEPSWPTRNVLFEHGLFGEFAERPEAVIAELHKAMKVAPGGPNRLLFALAELSYLHGEAIASREYRLAAAVYAYAFLFPEGYGVTAGRFDPRGRVAADIYNWAVKAAFESEDGSEVVPRGGTFQLPFGQLEVAFDPAALRAGDRELYRFIPISELQVHGMAMRYRWPGLGAPLAASTRPIDPSKPGRDLVAPAAQGAGDRSAPDRRHPAGSRARRAADEHAGAPPVLGRGIGRDRRRAGAARERADRGLGADIHGGAGLHGRDVRVPGATQRPDEGSAAARFLHAVPARADPRRVRARHGLEHRPLGGDVQPAPGRPRYPNAGSSSGSSSTTPASPWRCPRCACGRP